MGGAGVLRVVRQSIQLLPFVLLFGRIATYCLNFNRERFKRFCAVSQLLLGNVPMRRVYEIEKNMYEYALNK